MLPKISILIPTYNTEATIETLLKSIINQTYSNIEIGIIDGGSIDNTLSIVEKYKKHINFIISEKDFGIYDAMNKGIAKAEGDWLLFMGADDYLFNQNILETIFLNQNHEGYLLLYGKVKVKDSKQVIGEETSMKGILNYNIPHQAIFYNRKIFETIGKYNLRYKILADYDLNYRVFCSIETKTKFINKIISTYNKKGVSNYTLDEAFYFDTLNDLLTKKNLSKQNPQIQQFVFYTGIILLMKRQVLSGSKNIIHAIIFGNKKIARLYLLARVLLKILGVGKKLRYV